MIKSLDKSIYTSKKITTTFKTQAMKKCGSSDIDQGYWVEGRGAESGLQFQMERSG